MTWQQPSFSHPLIVTEDEARDIKLVETLETSEKKGFSWENADIERASLDARHMLDDKATAKDFLITRARLVLARMSREKKNIAELGRITFATTPAAVLVVLLAYLCGVFTDRLATSGAAINLLSPPLLAVFIWNLFVYLLLALLGIAALLHIKVPSLPLRNTLTRLFSKLRLPGLNKASVRSRFLALWSPLAEPLIRTKATQTLHLAALFFAIGMMTSILVRGIGTAYNVGWESTWFAQRPDIVLSLLRNTYGLIPVNWLGMSPIPDTAGIAAMNFAVHQSELASEAAPWLIRLMGLLTLVVLIPRALLALFSSLKLSHQRKRMPLSINNDYYKNLFSGGIATECELTLIINTPNSSQQTNPEKLFHTLLVSAKEARLCDSFRVMSIDLWSSEALKALESLNVKRQSKIWLLQDMVSTPESEVHGSMLAALNNKLTQSDYRPVLILNTATLIERFEEDSTRVRSRFALWETFATEYGTLAFCANLSEAKSRQALIQALQDADV